MTSEAPPNEDTEISDRGIPPLNRVRSMQSRVTATLAIGVSLLLGGGFLTWYYAGLTGERAPSAPKKPIAPVDVPLPPLEVAPVSPTVQRVAQTPAVEEWIGPPPPDPNDTLADTEVASPDDLAPAHAPLGSVERTSAERDRAGPAYISFVDRHAPSSVIAVEEQATADSEHSTQLSRSLVSAPVPTVSAQRLPDPRFLLAKGTSIDCTLVTAIDTTLPSLVTCVAATDTYSADGSVVLVERGAQLFGETRPAGVGAGRRVFVVWSEIRSGNVSARVDSPAADAQGRGGLTGTVNRHFWSRFGAAFLISLIDGGMDAATRSRDRNAAVVVNPDENQALLTEVLRSTADIQPTIGVAPGSRVNVLIARDINFSPVYELRHVKP